MLDATVTAQSLLQTPEQFANIVIKSQPDGAAVLLSDVARVELGSDSYNTVARMNQHPGGGIALLLAPGADALKTAQLVKAKVAELAKALPPGLKVAYANDTTAFIKLSVIEVVKTLAEAIVLVVLVMFAFLQSWRATLVPAIAVPVVLLGTFGVLFLAGFSINTMTLFGLVLAIGLLVDDAIVVVENVERLMEENPKLAPREATLASMKEITMALVAIALVLSAVFLPMAFFGGSTGVIYRQFSLTIISAMAYRCCRPDLSPRSPPLARAEAGALGRRGSPPVPAAAGALRRLRWVQQRFARLVEGYQRAVRAVLDRKRLPGDLRLVAVVLAALSCGCRPASADRGPGAAAVQFSCPQARQARTVEVSTRSNLFPRPRGPQRGAMFMVAGGAGPPARTPARASELRRLVAAQGKATPPTPSSRAPRPPSRISATPASSP